MLGDVLVVAGRTEEARAEYEKALQLTKTIEPEFQVRSVPDIERKLAGQ
jgi:predicted negative regulator of RcsB-dependent stress response